MQDHRKTMRQMRATVAGRYGDKAANTVKRWRNNGVTFLYTHEGRLRVAYLLHSTAIIEMGADVGGAFIKVNTGGWNGITTRRAIDEAMQGANGMMGRVYFTGVSVPHHRRKNRLANSAHIGVDGIRHQVEFENEILIRADGTVIPDRGPQVHL